MEDDRSNFTQNQTKLEIIVCPLDVTQSVGART